MNILTHPGARSAAQSNPGNALSRLVRDAVARRTCLRLVTAALVAILFVVTHVQAATMPNGARSVSLTAREQPVSAFLQSLFASVGVPANISPEIAGTVNGSFRGQARKVLADIARVYNLVGYYDGAVMHVVPAGALTRRTYAVTPSDADRMLRIVAEFGLTDHRNTLRRASDGSIQAFGTRRFVEQVDELFEAERSRQAAPPEPVAADFKVFYLRYASAQDQTITIGGRQVVVPGVASILRSLVGAEASQPLGGETVLSPTVPGLRGQGLAAQGAESRVGDDGRDGRDRAIDALVTALSHTAAQPQPQAPAIQPAVQQVRIEADPRLNAVIVRDRADRLPRYEQLVAALDVEPQSVEIEATIIDVNTDRMRELGIDWRLQRNDDSVGFSGGVPASGLGGVASVVLGSATQFFSRIRALQADGAARIVSSPQVVTLSNVEAIFDNTSTFFVRVAGREQVDLFNVSAGTSLRVTPNVFRDRDATRIKLRVQVEDGNLTGRQVDQIPIVERSSINTQALIQEGESLLIGGMVRDAASTSVDKVPVLGDVPVVGNLFRTEGRSNSRIERMFLITPRVAGSNRAQPHGAAIGIRQAAVRPATAVPESPYGTVAQLPRDVPAGAAGLPQTGRTVQAGRPDVTAPTERRRRSSVVLDLKSLMPAPGSAETGTRSPALRTVGLRRRAGS